MRNKRLGWVVGAMASTWALALAGFAGPVLAARPHQLTGSFGTPCAAEPCGAGELKEPTAIAVNETNGQIYVADTANNRIEIFTSEGTIAGELNGSGLLPGEILAPPTGQFAQPDGIAINNACARHKPILTGEACETEYPSNGHLYVMDTGHKVVDEYTPTGEYIRQITGTFREPPASKEFGEEHEFHELHGIATDTTNHLYIAESGFAGNEGGVAQYTNNQLTKHTNTSITTFMRGGLGVDAAGNLYVHTTRFTAGTDLIAEFSSAGVLLNEAVDRTSPSGVVVELSTGNVYVDEGAGISRFAPDGGLLEQLSVPGGGGTGVGVNDSTGIVYAADSTAGVIDQYGLAAPSAPAIESESASDVTANSAELAGEVNPHGAATIVRIEYGACTSEQACSSAAFDQSLPVEAGKIGEDFEIYPVSVHPQNLLPGQAYHYRLIAENTHGQTTGQEHTFTTQPAGDGGPVPIDGRQWQLVSPPNKHGAALQPIGEAGVIQAAADGSAISYFANGPTETNPEGNSAPVQVISRRTGGGWVSKDIATRHGQATGVVAGGAEYRLFSSDLSAGVVQPAGPFTPLSASASELTAYLRSDINPEHTCGSGCYRPLVTGCPPSGQACPASIQEAANVPPGTRFGGNFTNQGENRREVPEFRGATSDLSHIVLQEQEDVALTPGSHGGLYLWVGGQLSFLGTASAANQSFDAVSDDGGRVVFAGSSEGLEGLLVRDVGRGESLQVDAVEGGSGKGPARPVFQFATGNGSKVVFTDTQRLTADAGGVENEPDLYECQIVVRAGKLACELTDLTPAGEGGAPADVLGHVLGVSADGGTVYFVANGQLAPGAVHGNCTVESQNEPPGAVCSLYVWRGGVLNAVGNRSLSGEDQPDWEGLRSSQPTSVSSGGGWLVFMSQASLTGYDNRDVVSGVPDEEVFLYHAGVGVVCVSCLSSGARPHGVEYARLKSGAGGLAGGDRVWNGSVWLAGNVPGWTPYEGGVSVYQSRFLFDSGRLFFNSSDGLVAGDRNGVEDVYEFEPAGVGGCVAGGVGFVAGVGGCVGLVSSGKGTGESAFVEASVSGGDVFFLTSAPLTAGDTDTAVDLYDAHECDGVGAAGCFGQEQGMVGVCASADSCRGSGAGGSVLPGVPTSGLFEGEGNVRGVAPKPPVLTRAQKLGRALRACRALRKHRRRVVCERAARKRYGPVRKKVVRKKVVRHARSGAVAGRGVVGFASAGVRG